MKIPVYSRRVTPQAQAIGPRESPEEAKLVGRRISQAGKALSDIAVKFEELRAYQQTGATKVEEYKRVTELKTQAQNDVDIDDPEVQKKYLNQIPVLKEQLLSRISNNNAKSKYALQFDLVAIELQAQIGGYGRTALIHKDKATIYEANDLRMEEYIAADNVARQEILKEGYKAIDGLVSRGSLDPDTGVLQKRALKVRWEAKAKAREVDIEKTLKIARQENKRNLTVKMINAAAEEEKLTILEEAEMLLSEQKIDVAVYDDLKKRMGTPYAETLDLATYIEIQGMIEDEKPEQEIYDTILARTDKLTESVAKQLINDTQKEQKLNIKNIIKNESYGLKAWADREIGGAFTEEMITGEAKGLIEQVQYEFYRRMYDEDPKTREDIRRISEEVKEDYMTGKLLNEQFTPEQETLIEDNMEAHGKTREEIIRALIGKNLL